MQRVRVFLETLGCRVNQYDTAAMRDHLAASCEFTDRNPDVVILNACTVTASAERKARQAARRARRLHPEAVIVVVGCLADAVDSGLTRFSEADLLVGNSWKPRIDDVIQRVRSGERGLLHSVPVADLSEESASGPQGRIRAFLKIQDGCSRSCTYCRTTQVRGPARSKSLEAVVAEARDLIDAGFPEIVLTGIDLAQYAPHGGRLPDAVSAVAGIDGLRRLRLASINPSGITADLLDACATQATVCPHFHVPLQSGDDRILAAMDRGYNTRTYLAAIERIRECVPDATFGTDIIVGFPGEDRAAFDRTCSVLETVGYVNIHVFRFSPRRGTTAASLPDQLRGDVKHARSATVTQRWEATLGYILDNRIGSKQDVLVEERRGNVLYGYTRDYLYTTFQSDREIPVGSVVPVTITARERATLGGMDDDRIDTH